MNSVFFFLSGIFFKITDAKTFFCKRLWNLVVPFLFFYIASIPFCIVVDFWDFRSLSHFDWTRVLDLFLLESRTDYLSLNVPLWFLIVLCLIQSYSFFIFRLRRSLILLLALASLFAYDWLYTVPTYFMVNASLAWFSYFAFGFLIGKPLIQYMCTTCRKLTIFLSSLLMVIMCEVIGRLGLTADCFGLVDKVNVLMFVICFMAFCSFFDGKKWLELIRFFGKNSLVVLGAHLWILIPVGRIMFRLTRFHSPWLGLVMSLITAALLIPLINLMNRRIPYLVGKRN